MCETYTQHQDSSPETGTNTRDLTNEDIQRYSRQLLLPQFGTDSQKRLKASSALIVGLGGLGAPASLYLAGAGVGTLGILDRPDDAVEVSNLHRQILYTTADTNTTSKTLLTAQHLRARNPHVNIVTHETEPLTAKNAVSLANSYDIVLDCTDNVLTRYLLGDACAISKTPLISGAAIGLSGQLCVLSSSPDTPCYRCLFPQPPPPHCVGSCDAAGVLGPVPGVIGTLQALEAIKLLARFHSSEPLQGTLLLFDAMTSSFRPVKMRPRVSTCPACGDHASIDMQTYDYDAFVNGNDSKEASATKFPNIDPKYRISVNEFAAIRSSQKSGAGSGYTLIDVRPAPEYAICHLGEAESLPLSTIRSSSTLDALVGRINNMGPEHKTILLCRRGNASQRALAKLQIAGANNVFDIVGGLEAWRCNIDSKFPTY